MAYLTEIDARHLMEEARLASENTYSPYSKFPVGAAVLTRNGNITRGCNVENASYGLTICAERIAIGNTLSMGIKDIVAIAVYTPVGPVPPCGACRQFIYEFGPDIVVVFNHGEEMLQKTISELLPFAFSF